MPETETQQRWTRKHLLGLEELSADEIRFVLDTAGTFKEVSTRSIKKVPALRGRVMVNAFFEDSTRTRTSFALAAQRLSADIIDFSEKTSSVNKGETLIDTARTIEAMGVDVIVIRHAASLPKPAARSSFACCAKAARRCCRSTARGSPTGRSSSPAGWRRGPARRSACAGTCPCCGS